MAIAPTLPALLRAVIFGRRTRDAVRRHCSLPAAPTKPICSPSMSMDSLIRPVGRSMNVTHQTSARDQVGDHALRTRQAGLNWLWIAGLAFCLSFWATLAYLVITAVRPCVNGKRVVVGCESSAVSSPAQPERIGFNIPVIARFLNRRMERCCEMQAQNQ